MKPMLCHSVDVSDVDRLINDNNWFGQQKLDGDRLLIHVVDGKVEALNRQGEIRRNLVPARVLREFTLSGEWYFDGELMDDGVLWLFDLPYAAGIVTPEHDLRFRLDVLERLFATWQPASCVRLLATVRHPSSKRELFSHLRHAQAEGMVFKQVDGRYRPGKRSHSVLKMKFTMTVDCVVTAVRPEGRENCTLGLFEHGALVPVGSVSLIGRPAVAEGDVIEVRYLYAMETNRLLVQPVMVRRRDDKSPSECTIDQLMFTDRTVAEVLPKYEYVALNRRGNIVTGTTTEEPAAFAQERYKRRWQELTITNEAGEQVGGFYFNETAGPHGRRTWWGETNQTAERH